MRKLWTAGIVALVTLGSTGCASGTGDGTTGTDVESQDFSISNATDSPVTIMGFGTDDEVGQVRYDRAAEAVDVEVELAGGSLDMQQFLSAVASGDVPALIRADRNQIGMLASRGAILPLDACFDAGGIDTDMFVPSALEQVTLEGQIYGIPEFNSVQLTMANSELLDAAGLTIDAVNGSDPDAALQATDALTVQDGGRLSTIGFDSKLPEFLPLWADARGGAMLSEDGRTALLDSPEVVDALTWAVEVYDRQGGFGTVKAVRDSADFFGSGNQFASGTLGAMPMEQWYVNVLNEVSADAPIVFDTVRTTDGEPVAYASGSAWAIPAQSANAPEACRFAATMVETDSWMAAAQARADARAESGQTFTGLLTGNVEADRRIREELVTSAGQENWDGAVSAMYEANENTFSFPANPADAEFTTAWQDGVNRVLNGQMEVEESMAQAQDEAQAALDKAWEAWDQRQGGQ